MEAYQSLHCSGWMDERQYFHLAELHLCLTSLL
jgi:hypothetical protein